MSSVTAETRVVALLGNPVAHSFSPVIQNTAFREAGVDGVYVVLRCDEVEMIGFMRGLGAAGAGGNVTLPHKEKAASVLDSPTEAVRRTGACNTFWGENGNLCGDNTDVEGFTRALQHFLGGFTHWVSCAAPRGGRSRARRAHGAIGRRRGRRSDHESIGGACARRCATSRWS